jgi:hypothetical protein
VPYLNNVHLTPGGKITANGKQGSIANFTDNTGISTKDNIIENVPATATVPGVLADAATRTEVNSALASIENNTADLTETVNQILVVLRDLGMLKSTGV